MNRLPFKFDIDDELSGFYPRQKSVWRLSYSPPRFRIILSIPIRGGRLYNGFEFGQLMKDVTEDNSHWASGTAFVGLWNETLGYISRVVTRFGALCSSIVIQCYFIRLWLCAPFRLQLDSDEPYGLRTLGLPRRQHLNPVDSHGVGK